ncbi:right-handed parallel beta-helix repeat-containing protein [Maribacter sp. 2307ULW6-5]|uniref:right-handed parallel beta-helix repeat-containing protein n=1 Tax=Maribacter sp. 2307ULW6-5 TaxID=3386275 RepID=UPI0039BD0499
MSRNVINIVFVFFLVLALGACRKDFEYAPSNGHLAFSRDTVFLDTIFGNIGSATYQLKVYNTTLDAVSIPIIQLQKGAQSAYRINVDGVPGHLFRNVVLNAKDSLFIFIETTATENPGNAPRFLETDVLQFDTGPFLQEVPLVTLVQDAIFLYPPTQADGEKEMIDLTLGPERETRRLPGFVLGEQDLFFGNEKPYVIYGHALVPPGKTLIIERGARVHFHKNAGLVVANGANISIRGQLSQDAEVLEGEVVFEGDRLEPAFQDEPGQWSGLYLLEGSSGNTVDHLTIKNATVGLYVEGEQQPPEPNLVLKNTAIYNSSKHNLWALNASVVAENLVLGNSGNASLRCSLGGNYLFVHCTMANFWNRGFRTDAAVRLSNFWQGSSGAEVLERPLRVRFRNCIIDGNNANELNLLTWGNAPFEHHFSHCALRVQRDNDALAGNGLFNFDDGTLFNNIHFDPRPDYFSTAQNDFRMGVASDVIGLGSLTYAQSVPLDRSGSDRTLAPDLGAHQARPKE